MTTEAKEITLIKGDQQFYIRYDVGDEALVLESIIAMVNRQELDWFDAAILSHKVGVQLASEVKAIVKAKGKTC